MAQHDLLRGTHRTTDVLALHVVQHFLQYGAGLRVQLRQVAGEDLVHRALADGLHLFGYAAHGALHMPFARHGPELGHAFGDDHAAGADLLLPSGLVLLGLRLQVLDADQVCGGVAHAIGGDVVRQGQVHQHAWALVPVGQRGEQLLVHDRGAPADAADQHIEAFVEGHQRVQRIRLAAHLLHQGLGLGQRAVEDVQVLETVLAQVAAHVGAGLAGTDHQEACVLAHPLFAQGAVGQAHHAHRPAGDCRFRVHTLGRHHHLFHQQAQVIARQAQQLAVLVLVAHLGQDLALTHHQAFQAGGHAHQVVYGLIAREQHGPARHARQSRRFHLRPPALQQGVHVHDPLRPRHQHQLGPVAGGQEEALLHAGLFLQPDTGGTHGHGVHVEATDGLQGKALVAER